MSTNLGAIQDSPFFYQRIAPPLANENGAIPNVKIDETCRHIGILCQCFGNYCWTMFAKWEILICQIEEYLVQTKKGEIMNIKHTTLTASLALALALQAASVQPVAASDSRFEKVTNESNLVDVLVGKTLNSRDYTFTLNADYSFEGSYQDRPIRGRWMYVSNDAICFDFASSVHCGTPMINSGDVTSLRFERSAKVRNRVYLSNPYPNLLAEYSVSQ